MEPIVKKCPNVSPAIYSLAFYRSFGEGNQI